MLAKYKRADEIVSMWWFFCVLAVAIFISIGLIIVHSSRIDVREVEAKVLADRIADCLIDMGEIKFDIEKINEELILRECKFNQNVIAKSFYAEIYFDSKEIRAGNLDYRQYWGLNGKEYPSWSYAQLFALKDGKNVNVKIYSASNNVGERLS
ncbi:hypothetical protein HYW76_01840 [Candidatus Pacearchaeota archaeon]|nr:hypothetical protein [Candidatus Pacearchaeota archaeon]